MYSSSLLASYASELADQIAFYQGVVIITLILILIVHVVVAFEVCYRTEEKGYSGGKYAVLTFFMPVVGVLLMASLQDKRAVPQPVQVSVVPQAPRRAQPDELPDL